MNYINKCGLIVLLTGVLAACATVPNIDWDQSYDFSTIKTFRVVSPENIDVSDPRLDSPLVYARIQKAIQQVLMARGLEAVSEAPDMEITYRVGAKTGVESRGSGMAIGAGHYGYGGGVGGGYYYPFYDVASYDEGVFTIDMLAGEDKRLIWRGSSTRRLYEGSTPDSSSELINGVVQSILNAFPPGREQL